MSLFRSKASPVRFGNLESELGIDPVRLLNENSIDTRLLISLRKSGMGPERLAQVMTR